MSHNLIIAKFGGSSVADYIAMNHSADVVLSNPAIRLVVVSASAGVTNQLLILATSSNKQQRLHVWADIIRIQHAILEWMPYQESIWSKINDILGKIKILSGIAEFVTSAELTDDLISCGELMSSLLFVEVLRQRKMVVEWFDVRYVMRTNACFGCAEPDTRILGDLVHQKLKPHLSEAIIVTQGFIGQDKQGRTTTLGRGGSDYTAAILGEALQVKRIDIWTDVSGIYTIDPHLVPSAKRINEITFSEAAIMAVFGAKVLHPGTLLPAVRSDISIFIGSSKNPTAGGTIVSGKNNNLPIFRALTLRRKQMLLTLHSITSFSRSFLDRVFKTCLHHNVSTELIMISKVSVSLIIDVSHSSTTITNLLLSSLLSELSSFCILQVEENLALVAIIGNSVFPIHSVSQEVLRLLGFVNLRICCYGNQFIFCLLVHDHHAEKIITILHRKIFE
ncbi:Lysine-sensitive aspartokinase 3 [Candidatus Erwinia haradaeae]|uniref:Aspartokinase n=1 Tax=Candidatus Erwinia haradaeae TaxID=1922217 RepID=A0A451DC02_9GAMM|nr:lysine-sensitive aspartokinase 3 [Candidatus Erwinia haradaeae]VFP83945.1 Lysine-sensitive aspartokinase 3 [Candidatus Erwinia haradaeae]